MNVLILLLVLFVLFGGGWYAIGNGVSTVLVIVVLLVLFSGGGFGYWGSRRNRE